ncbi:MAG: hypothetical protein NZT92_06170 [Abditibacteriales bacterium]|nr:hypothetical protein [Abditibacteriales bacterium]
MKKEVSPPVVIGVIVLVVAIAVGLIFWRSQAPSFQPQTGGSEEAMGRVRQGDTLYQPPPGIIPSNPR